MLNNAKDVFLPFLSSGLFFSSEYLISFGSNIAMLSNINHRVVIKLAPFFSPEICKVGCSDSIIEHSLNQAYSSSLSTLVIESFRTVGVYKEMMKKRGIRWQTSRKKLIKDA